MRTERPEVTPLEVRLETERDAVRREALERGQRIEPTEEERRNGWTTETLTAYLAERAAGQALAVDVNSLHRRNARRPNESNHRYRPHRWRG